MAKRQALGRGLSSLLGEVDESYKKELGLDLDQVENIDLDLIEANPFQPRKNFDAKALEELASSIEEYGLIQPVILLKKNTKYILVAGERRFRACKLLQMQTIKAVIADIDERKLRELALIENIQREDLNPIELANSYKDLIKVHCITQERLAELIHKSRSQITNTLRLLSLDENTQRLISEGKISQGHAKVIVGLDKQNEKMVVDTILGQKLSVKNTEKIIQKIKNKDDKTMQTSSEELNKLKKNLNELQIKYRIQKNEIAIELSDIDNIKKLNKLFS